MKKILVKILIKNLIPKHVQWLSLTLSSIFSVYSQTDRLFSIFLKQCSKKLTKISDEKCPNRIFSVENCYTTCYIHLTWTNVV